MNLDMQLLRIGTFAFLSLAACGSTPRIERAGVAETPSARRAIVDAPGSRTPPALVPPRLAVGDSHVCLVGANRRLYCWGQNRFQQLGDGTDDARSLPVQVLDLEDVATVAAGGKETCAVDRGGKVFCWGGIRTPERPRPVGIALPKARSVSVGDYHSCAALADGGVRCWGANGDGQLGNGSSENVDKEAPVEPRGLSNVMQVAAAHSVSCALRTTGDVWCWGKSGAQRSLQPVKVEGLPPMRSIGMAWDNACGLTTEGTVYCWGERRPGRAESVKEPTRVEGWSGVRDLAVGAFHACAVLDTGDVSCIRYGKPETANGFSGYLVGRPKQVAAGNGTTCALAEDGAVRCVGLNVHGELGIGERSDSPEPLTIGGARGAIDVVPSALGGCTLAAQGKVSCWGFGRMRRENDGHAHTPMDLALEDVTRIFPGFSGEQTCAARKNGELWCFRSGRPDKTGAPGAPRLMKGLRDVTGIAALRSHGKRGAALVTTGAGELFLARETNDLTERDRPVREVDKSRIQGIGRVTQVVDDGEQTACAILRDKTVACWHVSASAGGDVDRAPKVVVVKGISDVVALARGNMWCVRTSRAETWCWSFDRPEAKAPLTMRLGPELQTTLTGATMLAGEPLTFLMPDGSVRRDQDKFGGAAWTGPKLPLYPAVLGALTLMRTRSNSCLLRPAGDVACWGSNAGEALGSTDRRETTAAELVKLPAEAVGSSLR